jgi:hypothetical protein
MIVAMHQPNLLPWSGLFYKMARADVFVYADALEFSKGSYTQRVKIRTYNGVRWLTLPVLHTGRVGERIIDLRCGGKPDWRERLVNSLKGSYLACPHYHPYADEIARIFMSGEDRLAELNVRSMTYLASALGIKTPALRASAVQPKAYADPTAWIIATCKAVGADTFLSGSGGANYQDEAAFQTAGIKLIYVNYQHPIYPQAFGEFVPGLSVIDLLFNAGPDSRRILLSDTIGADSQKNSRG